MIEDEDEDDDEDVPAQGAQVTKPTQGFLSTFYLGRQPCMLDQ